MDKKPIPGMLWEQAEEIAWAMPPLLDEDLPFRQHDHKVGDPGVRVDDDGVPFCWECNLGWKSPPTSPSILSRAFYIIYSDQTSFQNSGAKLRRIASWLNDQIQRVHK